MATTTQNSLRVLSFNLWHGGEMSGLPLEATANVIRQSGAHLVGLQEVGSKPIDIDSYHLRELNTRKISALLGNEWTYFDQNIVSPWVPLKLRHPQAFLVRGKIEIVTPLKWGIKVICQEKPYWIFNAHFAYSPYQPYQLLKIPYEETPFLENEVEVIDSAVQCRGAQVEELLREIEVARIQDPAVPIFLTGDFNEPSHLDWTHETAQCKTHPIKVEWPTTKSLATKGSFVDCFRAIHSDPIQHPGFTWSTRTDESDPTDHHDRIDFVFVSHHHKHCLKNVFLIGEKSSRADIVVEPYPSDHRAVLAEFEFP